MKTYTGQICLVLTIVCCVYHVGSHKFHPPLVVGKDHYYLLHKGVIDDLGFTPSLLLPRNSLCFLLNTTVELCDAGVIW